MCEVLDRIEKRGKDKGISQVIEGMLREGLALPVIERASSTSEADIRKIASSIGVPVVS